MPKDEQGWMVNVDARTYSQHLEKRVSSGERRPVIHNAADLLGPGYAPYVTVTDDFGEVDDRALISGFYATGNFVFQTIAFRYFDIGSASTAIAGRQISYGDGDMTAIPPDPPSASSIDMRTFNIILGEKRFSVWVSM